jgi:hypothetical protein
MIYKIMRKKCINNKKIRKMIKKLIHNEVINWFRIKKYFKVDIIIFD